MVKCGDCGRKKGELHSVGCDIERCPKCGGQLISCDCMFPRMSSDVSIFQDENGKNWPRKKIVTNCDM